MDNTYKTYDTDKLVEQAQRAGTPIVDVRPK